MRPSRAGATVPVRRGGSRCWGRPAGLERNRSSHVSGSGVRCRPGQRAQFTPQASAQYRPFQRDLHDRFRPAPRRDTSSTPRRPTTRQHPATLGSRSDQLVRSASSRRRACPPPLRTLGRAARADRRSAGARTRMRDALRTQIESVPGSCRAWPTSLRRASASSIDSHSAKPPPPRAPLSRRHRHQRSPRRDSRSRVVYRARPFHPAPSCRQPGEHIVARPTRAGSGSRRIRRSQNVALVDPAARRASSDTRASAVLKGLRRTFPQLDTTLATAVRVVL